MFDVKTMDEVIKIIKTQFIPKEIKSEEIDISIASGRILASDIHALEDLPGFNRSTVDGFAVISSDTFGAGDTMPAQLELLPEVIMGEKPTFSISKGQASPIPTGGELPENADSVVMVEFSEDYNDGFIYLNKSSAPGNHVIFKTDDCKKGDIVIREGSTIRPQEIGALAAIGVSKIPVYMKPRIAIISTGDEIIDIDENTNSGAKIRDVNSYVLFAGLLDVGCEPVRYGIVKDDFACLFEKTKRALEECDMVLISGGSSVGAKDHTCKVIEELYKENHMQKHLENDMKKHSENNMQNHSQNLLEDYRNGDYNHFNEDKNLSVNQSISENQNLMQNQNSSGVLVHGIAVKPGKPTILGKVCGKAIIGLPGHPVSAYMIFKTVVVPLICVLKREECKNENTLEALMKSNYPSNHGREEFMSVTIENENGNTYATPVFSKSGLITTLVTAYGYIHIKRGQEGLSQNEKVKVILF